METKNTNEIVFGLLHSLGWNPGCHDDQAIIETIVRRKTIKGIYSLNETGLLDSFFTFLHEAEIDKPLRHARMLSYKRVMVPITLLLLTYMSKLLIGIPSMNALPDLLFSNTAIMRLIGFNAYHIKNGICQRGSHKRSEESEQPKPISVQMLSNFIERFTTDELEDLFNDCIKKLAKFGAFQKEVKVIIDGSDLVTTDKYEGCGMKTTETKNVIKGKIVTKEVQKHGYKVVAIMDVMTQIPLAIKVVQIQNHEVNYAEELLAQSMENLGEYATITHFLCDRGFIDGQRLYNIHKMGILFYTPAKKSMAIYKDAKSIANAGWGVRKSIKTVGPKKEDQVTIVVGIEDLETLDSFCSAEDYSKKNCKDFAPVKLNAVVVDTYKNKKYVVDKGPVFITTDQVDNPFGPYAMYDLRSIVENLLFRETKQGWHLQKPPKKTKKAMTTHVTLSMLTYGLTMAYRDYMDETEKDSDEEYRSFVFGTERWRRQKKNEAMDHVIVFADDKYGILHLAELATLLGLPNDDAPEGMRTKKEIYKNRGISSIKNNQ